MPKLKISIIAHEELFFFKGELKSVIVNSLYKLDFRGHPENCRAASLTPSDGKMVELLVRSKSTGQVDINTGSSQHGFFKGKPYVTSLPKPHGAVTK